jgi:hypothetical protein
MGRISLERLIVEFEIDLRARMCGRVNEVARRGVRLGGPVATDVLGDDVFAIGVKTSNYNE